MFRKIFSVALLACLAAACSKSDKPADTGNADKPADTVSVQITGNVNKSFTAIGDDQVGVGFIRFTKTGFDNFVLNASTQADGVTYDISSGAFPLPLTTGETVYDGVMGAGGSAKIVTGNATDDYSGGVYYLFYDTDVNRSNSKIYVNIQSITDVGQFIRIKGQYHYNGAAVASDLSDPCVMEAVNNSGRQPAYNAALCGAKAIKVNASFTIYVNKLAQVP
ncbi:hypothetical protein [Chitinophaga sp. CB10]|uniref:hypothetical protein n=1 Tax=Chitinophaga sp. CB10 TaxID=1891659 RepID=UPI0025C2A41F|nr:hypothetical protein [Chitinophaga sp. CB10]